MHESLIIVKKENVRQLIPHKAPFILVDALYYYDDESAVSAWYIPIDHVMVRDNYLLDAAIVEHMAQTMALKSSFLPLGKDVEEKSRVGYLAAVSRFNMYNRVSAGSEIFTEIKTTLTAGNMLAVEGITRSFQQIMAVAELRLFLQQ